jgi:hypothetical protein
MKARFQFRLRTLMVGVTVFCVVISGYTGWQKKIVKERQEWLHAHSRQPDVHYDVISGLRIGDDKQRPGLIRCWLGDEPQEYLKLKNPAPEEIEAAHQLFPEANFFKFQTITQASGDPAHSFRPIPPATHL